MGIFSPTLTLGHLVQLVATDQSDPHKIVEKSFEWEHSRSLELAKWLLALSSSILVAVSAATLSKQFSVDTKIFGLSVVYLVIALATVFAASGVLTIWRSYILHKRYMEVSALLASLVVIKPFLVRLKRQGLI